MKLLTALVFLASVAGTTLAQWANVARDKPAFQTGVRGTAFPGLAVDNNVANVNSDDMCSVTLFRRNASAWWGVDLIRRYEIRAINLTLPREFSVMSNVSVLVGPSVRNLTACGTVGRARGRTISLRCNRRNVRFVGVFRPSGGVISLCDVNVEGRLMNTRRNDSRLISSRRSTILMSTPVRGMVGRRAVDGNINQNPDGGSCALTRFEEGAFLRIDLGRMHRIDRVVVYAMRTRGTERRPLRDYVIEGSRSGVRRWRECETHYGIADSGSITAMRCTSRIRARFVRLRVRDVGRLGLCEVNVYGWRLRRRGRRGGIRP